MLKKASTIKFNQKNHFYSKDYYIMVEDTRRHTLLVTLSLMSVNDLQNPATAAKQFSFVASHSRIGRNVAEGERSGNSRARGRRRALSSSSVSRRFESTLRERSPFNFGSLNLENLSYPRAIPSLPSFCLSLSRGRNCSKLWNP